MVRMFKMLPKATQKHLIRTYIDSLNDREKEQHVEEYMELFNDIFMKHISQVQINSLLDRLDDNTKDFIRTKLKKR